MTDCEEEQRSELEALRSIYSSDEFTELGISPSTFEVTITVEGCEEDQTTLTATVQFMYTPGYPDTPLNTGVTHSNLDPAQITELEQMLRENAEELVGTVMVFTLVSMAQEWLGGIIDQAQNEKEEEILRAKERQRQIEEAVFHGTAVTKETFAAWKEEFHAEMNSQSWHGSKEGRLTGKQQFEKDASLALSDMKYVDMEGEDAISDQLANQLEVLESIT